MIKGSLVALVTPMQKNNKIDFTALEKLITWHIDQGTDALVIIGTTGESPTLTSEEKNQIITQTITLVNNRIPVIVGTGTNATHTTIELTRAAKNAGADACLLVTPYYNRPTQQGLIAHFTQVAEAVDIPQILYNVPTRTGCDLLPDTVAQLATHNNIIGIKEATGNVDRVKILRGLCPKNFALYSGDDSTATDFMLQGGDGVISVAANLVPTLFRDLCHAALQNQRDQALLLHAKLKELFALLSIEPNPIPVKWGLHTLGMIEDSIRLPLLSLSERHRDLLATTVARFSQINVNCPASE